MGKKGRQSSDLGPSKGSNLTAFIRGAEQFHASRQHEVGSANATLLPSQRSRPLLDVQRFHRLLDSCTDASGRQIVSNAPFTDSTLRRIRSEKERRAASANDEQYYNFLEQAIKEGPGGADRGMPVALQLQCIPLVAKHHSESICPFLLASLPPIQQHLLNLALCRLNKMTSRCLEVIAQSRPDTLILNGAIDEAMLFDALRTTERLPRLSFQDSWEDIDLENCALEVKFLKIQSLYTNLLHIHLVGSTLTIPGLRQIGELCGCLVELTLHRINVIAPGVGCHNIDWHDTLCAIFLITYRASLWTEGGSEEWGMGEMRQCGKVDDARTEWNTGGLHVEAGAGTSRPRPCYVSLLRLELSHCWPSDLSGKTMQAFALSLYVCRNSAKGGQDGLVSLAELRLHPGVAEDEGKVLKSQFARSSINFS